MKIYACEKCHTPIRLSIIKGNVHIVCPACGQKYQLDQKSLKFYMVIPFICVIFAVGTSLALLNGRSIDIKFIYILTVAFVSAALLELLCVKVNFFKYEEVEENR